MFIHIIYVQNSSLERLWHISQDSCLDVHTYTCTCVIQEASWWRDDATTCNKWITMTSIWSKIFYKIYQKLLTTLQQILKVWLFRKHITLNSSAEIFLSFFWRNLAYYWFDKLYIIGACFKGLWPDHFFDPPNLPQSFWDFGTNRWLIFFSFTFWNLAFQNWVFTKK